MSTIYDVSNELAVDSVLSKSMNENKLFIAQLDNISKNSIVMGDGHYFTQNVLKKMKSSQIYGIFKVPRNIKICKQFINCNKQSDTYNYKESMYD